MGDTAILLDFSIGFQMRETNWIDFKEDLGSSAADLSVF
jgi:hypothetical protein